MKYELEGFPQLSSQMIDWVVNGTNDDDDHAELTIMTELDLDAKSAWDICDAIWDKYGRV